MPQKSEDELLNDHELLELIDQLRPVPERDHEAAKRGRVRFLSQVSALFDPKSTLSSSKRSDQMPSLIGNKAKIARAKPQKRIVYSVMAIVILMALILFGGAGATAYAAQGALPGDALYPIKTGLEQTRVTLARDAGDQAQLHLEFAERRLQEISVLIKEGRFGEIDQAASEFEYHVQQAINALQTVAAGDPARANMLAGRIARTLSEYGKSLSVMMTEVPDDQRPSMQRAIQASQSGSIMPLDENVNMNENENLNENENENENININLNENDNANGNDNTDENNSNININENENNEQENTNLNSNGNSNTNINEDQENHNSNDHEQESNTNTNTNTNNNHNSNDDHEENRNDNTNHNDNGGD